MILADLPELEKISGELISVAIGTDEVLNSVRKTLSEIQNDVELTTYPQHADVCESVALCVESLNRSNDMLQTLKGTLQYISGEYEANEIHNINALSRMTTMLSNIHTNLVASTAMGRVTTVEQSDQIQSSSHIRELVSDSAMEMQVTNIAAVGKVVKEEYSIKQVEDMENK